MLFLQSGQLIRQLETLRDYKQSLSRRSKKVVENADYTCCYQSGGSFHILGSTRINWGTNICSNY